MNILLIEDDEAINFLYKRELEKSGYPTEAVYTGAAGFEKLSVMKFDLILLDVMLPDMNGLEILRRLKSNKSTHDIPVLMLSNLGQDTVMQEAYQLGAKEYLIKASYEPKDLIIKIQSLFVSTPVPSTSPETSQVKT